MKHEWTVDVAVPLTRDEAQHKFYHDRLTVKLGFSGPRRIYCRRCWATLDHKNLDGECVSKQGVDGRGDGLGTT